ncbi:uncharacterized protein UMAG_02966 [Mycosarcoma maydis]|uniref:Uncharacterized protein n=1 Tax=Mycosarcoma maydis TaxID=5270 RepID=A0A0D1C5R5_MYCMD|nr:uncharacterized protein UMAG_02966 [Ustilago maydis 521]KIS68987.1 hypothetical protein UMAG_02966 [Ustilago maydis 521]|eukprot:XP_011389364.1 hypothetical protein UMAG_02966 [Ustilago maydis 521]
MEEADQLFRGSGNDLSIEEPMDPHNVTTPTATSSLPTSSTTHLPPDSELVASLPVYLSKSLLGDSSLHVFQYPIYPRDRPLPVPYSAAARGLKVSSRWRPRANRVEVELPLDVREEVYNADRGIEFGAGAEVLAQKQARADAAHGGSTTSQAAVSSSKSRIKQEQDHEAQANRGPKKLEKIKLESTQVPNATEYMVGVIRDQALHLTRLESIVQLRPSMNYLDALDEAREAEKRRDRAAMAGEFDSDEEDEDELIEMEAPGEGSSRSKSAKKDAKKPTAQTLSVALRTDPNAKKGGGMGIGGGGSSEARDMLMAAQREADAERWIDLEWRDEGSHEAQQVFDTQLFASSKTALTCHTKPRDYLLHALP